MRAQCEPLYEANHVHNFFFSALIIVLVLCIISLSSPSVRNPTSWDRPSFSEICGYLNASDDQLLNWTSQDKMVSERVAQLGAPHSEARNLYPDLQYSYNAFWSSIDTTYYLRYYRIIVHVCCFPCTFATPKSLESRGTYIFCVKLNIPWCLPERTGTTYAVALI